MTLIQISDWALLSPVASDKDEFVHALQAERPRGRRLPIAAHGGMDRLSALTVRTADQLLGEDWKNDVERQQRTAVVLGTSTGSLPRLAEMTHDSHYGRTPYDIRPSSIASMVPNAAAGQVAIRHRVAGPNSTVAAKYLSGLQALSVAARMIRSGGVDYAIAGAVEELSPQRLVGDRLTRPRDRRVALPAGEGCVLTLLEHRTDGAGTQILGTRYGSTLQPSAREQRDLLAQLVRELLEVHEIAASDVDLVSMSQSGPVALCNAERAAVRYALWAHEPRLLAVSDLVGNTYSAASAFQVAGALALQARHSLITVLGDGGEVAAMLLRYDEASAI